VGSGAGDDEPLGTGAPPRWRPCLPGAPVAVASGDGLAEADGLALGAAEGTVTSFGAAGAVCGSGVKVAFGTGGAGGAGCCAPAREPLTGPSATTSARAPAKPTDQRWRGMRACFKKPHNRKSGIATTPEKSTRPVRVYSRRFPDPLATATSVSGQLVQRSAICYTFAVVKEKIHPTWYPDARVACACGSVFTTGSTQKSISVEVCAACHPFFTGQQKFLDTAGRVDKFNQRVAAAEQKKAEAAERKRKKDEAAAAAEA
jgi:large subunit ribosomal protein L31